MKKLLVILIVLNLMSCKKDIPNAQDIPNNSETMMQPKVAPSIPGAVIYEANIRQYSPQGTFNEFIKDIPVLKQLGVKFIWVMPIHPISLKNRKATGGSFVADIEDETEKKKYLGSYYAVADYKGINPEFGNLNDFKVLVTEAHKHDISVIIDWVPNHTGWDHHWINEHPNWYTKNDNGEIIHPVNTDWTDVADLNYNNKDMRQAMIEDMLYWIEEADIDGFRCDMAGMVPLDFWEQAIPQLRAKKDIFMLAEAWEPQLMNDGLFDMAYGWETHHIMNRIAKGENSLQHLNERYDEVDRLYKDDDILMNFVTNHDENSWAGSLSERMPNNKALFTALSYTLPGMPLIYSGQEYDMSHRLKFFEKDSIPKERGTYFELLEKLGALKNTSKALHSGAEPGSFTVQSINDHILLFNRAKEDEQLLFLGNLSNKTETVNLTINGTFKEYLSGEEMTLNNEDFTIGPWQFYILVPNHE